MFLDPPLKEGGNLSTTLLVLAVRYNQKIKRKKKGNIF